MKFKVLDKVIVKVNKEKTIEGVIEVCTQTRDGEQYCVKYSKDGKDCYIYCSEKGLTLIEKDKNDEI